MEVRRNVIPLYWKAEIGNKATYIKAECASAALLKARTYAKLDGDIPDGDMLMVTEVCEIPEGKTEGRWEADE